MNNKKIVGDGSKATLPGGKKMENYKKPPSYNSLTNTNAMAGSGNQNQSEQTEGKQKSKGEQVAQSASSEALKKGLKASFPYVPQFLINKLVDSNLGQAVIEQQLKKFKRKMMMYVAGAVAGIVGSILGICIIMAAILGPVGALGDVAKGIGKFFASIGNLFVYGEYCADETSCQEILSNKYYEKLDEEVNSAFQNCDNVDKEQVKDLIAGTIFYDQMSYENDYEIESSEAIDSEKETDREAGYEQQENPSGYFDYRGKRGDIHELVTKLKDDNNSCVLDSYAYRNHLTNNYIRNNYKYILQGEFKDGIEGKLTIDEVVNEIMMIGDFSIGGENISSGEIIIGAGTAGAIPDAILSNCTSPLGNQQMKHTSCFGYYSPSNCTSHTGIDIGSGVNDPKLYSIADGEVVTVRSNAVHCEPDWKNGKACSVCASAAGNRVSIKHSIIVDGITYEFYSEYMHLKSINVRAGQSIKKGEQVGIMGNTGCSTSTHLHFNMLDASKKRYNPEELLQYLNLSLRPDCDEARRVCSR